MGSGSNPVAAYSTSASGKKVPEVDVLEQEFPTFLNMMRDMTASAVNSPAMRIMMMPTAMLVFRHVRAEIQPLREDRMKGPVNASKQGLNNCT